MAADALTRRRVAIDMLRVAHAYNNVLYKSKYLKSGKFDEKMIKSCFKSYAEACRSLKIINPEDPYCLDAVLEDILYVLDQEKDISTEIYHEYGIYTIAALIKQYGSFERLMAMALGKRNNKKVLISTYKTYPLKTCGRNTMLRWVRKSCPISA